MRNKYFPNLKTSAYYSPLSQYIMINSKEERQFIRFTENLEKYINKPNPETTSNLYSDLEIFKLYYHELRHWLDQHSTLWGLQNLVNLYNSYMARLTNNPEYFFLIAKFMKELHFSDLTNYFKTIDKNEILEDVNELNIWQCELSAGLRFNPEGYLDKNKPILFNNFKTYSGEQISRVPISIYSLLETGATFEEFYVHSNILNQLDENDRIVGSAELKRETLRWLYNPKLSLYSVIAHLTSITLDIKDVIKTFEICSKISTLVLNIPDELYPSIKVNNSFDLWNIEERNKKFLLNGDKGFMYLNLLRNYERRYKKTGDFSINELLKLSNLPTEKEIRKLIKKKITNIKKEIFKGIFYSKLIKILDMGESLFDFRGLTGSINSSFRKSNKNEVCMLEYKEFRVR